MGKFTDQVRSFQLRAEGLAEQTARLAILEVWSRLIARSPVDTGRFRAAWTTSYDEIVVSGRSSAGPVPGGAHGPPAPPAFFERVIGRRYFIANNVPYALKLEEGGSNQAPNGLARLTAMEWPDIVRSAVRAAHGGEISA